MNEINNFRNTQLPQIQEDNKPYRASYVVLFVLIVIGGVATYFGWFYKPVANNTSTSTPPVLSPTQQLDLEKRTLLASGIIKFNPVMETTPIAIGKLPEILKNFVDQSATDLTINQLKYEGGLTGFEIDYVLKDVKMQDVERRFQLTALNNKFEMLKGSRAERFGFSDYESAEYKVRVLYTLDEDNTVKINVNIINIQ